MNQRPDDLPFSNTPHNPMTSGDPRSAPADRAQVSSVGPVLYVLLGLLVGAGGVAAGAFFLYGLPTHHTVPHSASEPARTTDPRTATVQLVEGMLNTLVVPKDVRDALSIGESATAAPPERTRPLVLPGSTALDPTKMMRIRTRFNAEVIEIKPPKERQPMTSPRPPSRELRSGDTVDAGEALAVVWSVDVGSKKSDLLDALLQLRLDEERLKRRIELWKNGSIPEDTLNQTRRDVVADQSAAGRAERTLRTWSIPEREIQAVYDEAKEAYQGLDREIKRDKEKEKLWARSELVSPMSGTVVERNISKGEFLADSTANLFVIADVGRLLIQVNPPEELLPALLKAQKEGLPWKIETVGLPHRISGPIDEITYIVDPILHTAVVKGYMDNPGKQIRAGQFVTATIDLPPPEDVVEVPLTALVEEGKQSFVFVLTDPARPSYTLRRVVVTHRFDKVAFVRSKLTPAEQALTPEEKEASELPRQPLEPGTKYLPTGALELRAALEDKQSQARQKKQ
jgi:cobalt-zinc-cadmium efflux system membrane fusion protein